MSKNSKIKTCDLGFAAYLMCAGATISNIEVAQKARRRFVFDGDIIDVTRAHDEYYTGKATVEPNSYREALARLKGMLSTKISTGVQ